MQNKIEVAFYNFTITPILIGVPRLIKKIYDSRQKLLVVCHTENEMQELDRALWTFSPKEFIPHCMSHEENYKPHINPVLFSISSEDNKNKAEVVLNLSGIPASTINPPEDIESDECIFFKKHLYAFYGKLEEHPNMFTKYNFYKNNANIACLNFWKQTKEGRWHQEA